MRMEEVKIQKKKTLMKQATVRKAKGNLYMPVERHFLLIGKVDYSHRRTVEGCEAFGDLPDVANNI